jgi:uncharacterized protein (TIGR00299 family) protein
VVQGRPGELKKGSLSMKIAYFDCFSGASGDMILGALLDAGLPLEKLKAELAKLNLVGHYELGLEKVTKKGLGGSRAIVTVAARQHRRHLSDIRTILGSSDLDERVKEKALAVFTRLARAEAKVHGTTIDSIHFHEVGAMDAIVDVVGAVAGLAAMGVERIHCSALNVGGGTVECAHGTLPVPAPATAELLRGKPVYSSGIECELLTPTGAAILTTLAEGFGAMPAMVPEAVGYGAGAADLASANLLRVTVGQAAEAAMDLESERVAVVETSIDDMNPQVYDYLMQQLLQMGAMDVFLVPLHMKKNRPGTLVTVLCAPAMIEQVAGFLINETTSIGLRWRLDNRLKARREIETVDTPYGPVRVKVARAGGDVVNVAPEYDDCKRVAMEQSVPLRAVMDAARSAAERSLRQ